MSVAQMALSLFTVNQGYFDGVEVKKIVVFEHELQSYMQNNHKDLLAEINQKCSLDAELEQRLTAAVESFTATAIW